MLLEPFEDAGLKGFLAGYGITLDDGIILDVNQISQSLRISPIMPIALSYGPTPITRDFKNTITMFPLSRPLTLEPRGQRGELAAPGEQHAFQL